MDSERDDGDRGDRPQWTGWGWVDHAAGSCGNTREAWRVDQVTDGVEGNAGTSNNKTSVRIRCGPRCARLFPIVQLLRFYR